MSGVRRQQHFHPLTRDQTANHLPCFASSGIKLLSTYVLGSNVNTLPYALHSARFPLLVQSHVSWHLWFPKLLDPPDKKKGEKGVRGTISGVIVSGTRVLPRRPSKGRRRSKCPQATKNDCKRQFTMPRAPYKHAINPGRHEKRILLTNDCVYW